jgi:hypothetical protein
MEFVIWLIWGIEGGPLTQMMTMMMMTGQNDDDR